MRQWPVLDLNLERHSSLKMWTRLDLLQPGEYLVRRPDDKGAATSLPPG